MLIGGGRAFDRIVSVRQMSIDYRSYIVIVKYQTKCRSMMACSMRIEKKLLVDETTRIGAVKKFLVSLDP